MITSVVLNAAQKYMISQYPNEGCGFVVGGVFIPVLNISRNPTEEFLISDEDFLKYSPICSVFLHSHPDAYNCPSKTDMQQQQSSGITWGILSTTATSASDIQLFGEKVPIHDLMHRGFCHGVTDCEAFIKDWCKVRRGFSWDLFPRDWKWWLGSDDLYQDNFGRFGFKVVPKDEISKLAPIN